MTTNGRNSGAAGDADRDPRLDRLYRDMAREEPPASLDAAILAAARREVGARPRAVSARLRAWRVPVSIAAVLVVSVSLVTLVREEGGGRLESAPSADRQTPLAASSPAPPAPAPAPGGAPEPARTQTPAAAPAARDDAAHGITSTAKVAEATKRDAAGPSTARSAEPQSQAPPRAAMRSPQPFQAEPLAGERRPVLSADQAREAGMANQSAGAPGGGLESASKPTPAASAPAARMMQRDQGAASDTAGSLRAPAPATAVPAEKAPGDAETRSVQKERVAADPARLAALFKEFGSQPPEKWLEKIEALKRDGLTGEADEMLVEFKRRFPDHPLPPRLR